jgi:hypothetical protein
MYILNFFVHLFKSAGESVLWLCRQPQDDRMEAELLVSEEERERYESVDAASRRPSLGLTAEYKSWLESRQAQAHCIMHILFYVSLAIGGFSFIFEKWPIIDSIYFAVVIFTTVGKAISVCRGEEKVVLDKSVEKMLGAL